MQELAALSTEPTGVPVTVVTAASGTYSDTLTAEMAKSDAPPVYTLGNLAGLKDWDEDALDRTGTPLAGELTTPDFTLSNESGELKAIGHCYESFGIITNKALLDWRAEGHRPLLRVLRHHHQQGPAGKGWPLRGRDQGLRFPEGRG